MRINSPVGRGFLGKCPNCGEGRLFAGYLTFAEACESCSTQFNQDDAGDGPAVLVMSVVGFLIIVPVLAVEKIFQPPIWVHSLLWLPLATILVVVLLRPFRGLWYGLMFKHDARPGVLDTSRPEEEDNQ